MTSLRDLKYPPLETAFGVRVGDIIELGGRRAEVIEIRTGYARGSGIRAMLLWEKDGIAQSGVSRSRSVSLKDPERLDGAAIVERAPGLRAKDWPDDMPELEPRPAEFIDEINWTVKKHERHVDQELMTMRHELARQAAEIRRLERLVRTS